MEICKILVFFLVVSSLVSALTAASRNLKEISSENKAAGEEDDDEVMMDLSGGVLEEKRYKVPGRGRMDMETLNDYSGTGANTHHDPKPPGSND